MRRGDSMNYGEEFRKLEKRIEELEKKIEEMLEENNKIKHNEFKGMEIQNFYCNGYFGRHFDLAGSIIMENSPTHLTIRTRSGEWHTARFDEDENYRDLVEEWTTEDGYEV